MALESVNGRQTFFGPLPTRNKWGGKVHQAGEIKEIKYEFAFDDLPNDDENNEMVIAIPANSLVMDSTLKVGTAFAGGTSYTIGLEQKDGTIIDADGLHTAAQLVTASLTAGAILVGGGALVGASTGSAEGVVAVVATGTFTAGTATLIVRYMPIGADDA